MPRRYDVLLYGEPVGQLRRDRDNRVAFRLSQDYRANPRRPVLGQQFQENPAREHKGRYFGYLPDFFANLVPEGVLRSLIERHIQAGRSVDEVDLISVLGRDLPGAVEVVPGPDEPDVAPDEAEDEAPLAPETSELEEGLRFSLAGVQLKFSVVRDATKITLPVKDQHGDWIVKFDTPTFPQLARNEFAIMRWAEAAGFDVPECALEPTDRLGENLRRFLPRDIEQMFLIQRYDRDEGRRIHQEDFAQVLGCHPTEKYGGCRKVLAKGKSVTYAQLVYLISVQIGEDAAWEAVRRLVLIVASGNSDAHLKNWSLIYPDRVTAQLSPLYDQVSTVAWPEVQQRLSLNLGGDKAFESISISSFERLAQKSGLNPAQVTATVRETLLRLRETWGSAGIASLLPEAHADRLRTHWASVPLLQPFGPLP